MAKKDAAPQQEQQAKPRAQASQEFVRSDRNPAEGEPVTFVKTGAENPLIEALYMPWHAYVDAGEPGTVRVEATFE